MHRRSLILFLLSVLLIAPAIAFAQTGDSAPSGPGFAERVQQGAAGTAQGAGLDQVQSLEDIIGSVINTVLGFLGVLLLGYIIYAGFLWMTAGGDKGNVEKATGMIRNAIIGLIIIAASYGITTFVLSRIAAIQTGGGGV